MWIKSPMFNLKLRVNIDAPEDVHQTNAVTGIGYSTGIVGHTQSSYL
jgi:hypothetical protein